MKDFAAIDFETANNERSSVCSVGIVIVRNGRNTSNNRMGKTNYTVSSKEQYEGFCSYRF